MNADEAKDEAIRLLDDHRWWDGVWDAWLRRFLRRLCAGYLLLSLIGMFTIAKTWPHRICLSVSSISVLLTYVWSMKHRHRKKVTK